MNKSNAAEFLPLVQALADGKTIQFKDHGKWFDLADGEIGFGNMHHNYRVKPEPREFAGIVESSGYNVDDNVSYFTLRMKGSRLELPEFGSKIKLLEILD